MYFLLEKVDFQPAMLVYQRVSIYEAIDGGLLITSHLLTMGSGSPPCRIEKYANLYDRYKME